MASVFQTICRRSMAVIMFRLDPSQSREGRGRLPCLDNIKPRIINYRGLMQDQRIGVGAVATLVTPSRPLQAAYKTIRAPCSSPNRSEVHRAPCTVT